VSASPTILWLAFTPSVSHARAAEPRRRTSIRETGCAADPNPTVGGLFVVDVLHPRNPRNPRMIVVVAHRH